MNDSEIRSEIERRVRLLNMTHRGATLLPLDFSSTPLIGEVPIANGGTGQSNASAAFDALAPTRSTGGMILKQGGASVALAVGSDGDVLTADSGAPQGVSWQTPAAGGLHASSHENGGGDEISVAGLSGLLADPQTPTAHSHDWADVTGEPTTLAGYGITDGATDAELAAHEADATNVHGIADTSALSLNGHTHGITDVTSLPAELDAKALLGFPVSDREHADTDGHQLNNGEYLLHLRRLILSGATGALTLEGDSRIELSDLSMLPTIYLGVPKAPCCSFTVRNDYLAQFPTRLSLRDSWRVTLEGNADLLLFDGNRFPTSRLILTGRG